MSLGSVVYKEKFSILLNSLKSAV